MFEQKKNREVSEVLRGHDDMSKAYLKPIRNARVSASTKEAGLKKNLD